MTLIGVVALVPALGVTSRVFADRLRIPSVPSLILAGVAIILFEGSYHLRLEKLRESPTVLLRLTTVGAAITWLRAAGTTVVRRRGRVGLFLAERLERDGENLLVVDGDPDAVERAVDRVVRFVLFGRPVRPRRVLPTEQRIADGAEVRRGDSLRDRRRSNSWRSLFSEVALAVGGRIHRTEVFCSSPEWVRSTSQT